jgi:hypothetical protein
MKNKWILAVIVLGILIIPFIAINVSASVAYPDCLYDGAIWLFDENGDPVELTGGSFPFANNSNIDVRYGEILGKFNIGFDRPIAIPGWYFGDLEYTIEGAGHYTHSGDPWDTDTYALNGTYRWYRTASESINMLLNAINEVYYLNVTVRCLGETFAPSVDYDYLQVFHYTITVDAEWEDVDWYNGTMDGAWFMNSASSSMTILLFLLYLVVI